MKNSLRISFSLKNTYRVNSILYAIKQVPILKKILPDALYRMRGFKIVGWILSVMWEVFSAIIGKAVFFLFVAGCAFGLLSLIEKGDFSHIYINLFFFLSLIGGVTNLYMFDTHKSKYYAIMQLNMDAKEYNLINYIYSQLKLIVCYYIGFLILALLTNIPLWLCLIAPLGVAGLKNTVVALVLHRYDKKSTPIDNNPLGRLTLPFVILCALLGAGIHFPVPYAVYGILFGLLIISGILCCQKIVSFKNYRQVSRETLTKSLELQENAKNNVKTQTTKSISNKGEFTSNRKGFEYLNELFIKRHSKILWKPVKIISLVFLGLFLVGFVVMFRLPEAKEGINELLMSGLPYLLFIMYAINRGTSFTQALFINCDHSLLTYSVYKKPENILKLFRIRLREVIKMNIVPALIIGVGLSLALYFSGGTDNPVNYVVLLTSLPAMSIFFSTHNLTIYYLLQPYNANTEIKSATYQIIMGITYAACYIFMQLELPTLIFGGAIIIFCILYFIIACIIVYKLAPKTFKIRV